MLRFTTPVVFPPATAFYLQRFPAIKDCSAMHKAPRQFKHAAVLEYNGAIFDLTLESCRKS